MLAYPSEHDDILQPERSPVYWKPNGASSTPCTDQTEHSLKRTHYYCQQAIPRLICSMSNCIGIVFARRNQQRGACDHHALEGNPQPCGGGDFLSVDEHRIGWASAFLSASAPISEKASPRGRARGI